MALDPSAEFLRGHDLIPSGGIETLKTKTIVLPSNFEKVNCKSHFEIYHHPYNHHHRNDFDEHEFCK